MRYSIQWIGFSIKADKKSLVTWIIVQVVLFPKLDKFKNLIKSLTLSKDKDLVLPSLRKLVLLEPNNVLPLCQPSRFRRSRIKLIRIVKFNKFHKLINQVQWLRMRKWRILTCWNKPSEQFSRLPPKLMSLRRIPPHKCDQASKCNKLIKCNQWCRSSQLLRWVTRTTRQIYWKSLCKAVPTVSHRTNNLQGVRLRWSKKFRGHLRKILCWRTSWWKRRIVIAH